MIRVLALLLAATAVDQPSPCEDQATRAWNTLAVHSKDYLDKRQSGVRDVKLRAQLYKDFEKVFACDCF